jgi:flagellar biosynthetic protein FliR
MNDSVQLLTLLLNLPLVALVMARISGLMAFAPFFSTGQFPIKAKALLTVALTLVVLPCVGQRAAIPTGLGELVAAITSELLIGLFFGFGLMVLFTALELTGQLIGQQMGLSLASEVDPLFEQDSTVISQLYFWLAIVIFLLINGHLELLGAIIDSFKTLPIGGFAVTDQVISTLSGTIQAAFAVALQVAAPIVLTMFLTTLALGFVARTVPQLNILSVGFPLRVILGFTLMIVSLVAGINVFLGAFEGAFEELAAALK